MKWRSPSPADKSTTLIRPLLQCAKADLLAQARAHKIGYRDDATNFSPDLLRNRIRNELVPLLQKKYQPAINKTVLRLMEITGAEAEFAAEAAREFGAKPARAAAAAFDQLPLAVQRKVLQQQLSAAGLTSDFDLVEKLRAAPGRKISVLSGLTVERDVAGRVGCHADAAVDFNTAEISVNLDSRAGQVTFAGRRLRWSLAPMKRFALPKKSKGGQTTIHETFDAQKIGPKIILRHWRPGDRFQPIGLKSAVKLQDLFVNAKIPAARRRVLIVASTASGEIFWVEGLRIGENFKLTSGTRQKLGWSLARR